MAEILIMKEQVVEGFLEDASQCPVLKPLISSSTYIVNWDGQEYICEAYEAPSEYYPSGTCILGNEKYMNALISGSQAEIVEPFMIFIYPDDDYNGFATFVCMDEGCTSDSHIIAIYEVEESNGIVIKDPLGRSITYGEYDKILLNRANGEKTIYSMGEAVDSVNVELDFSNGDIKVDGGEGKLMKSVVIEKPETLLPENIISGVTIAGVDGEAVGNGEEKIVELDFTNGNQEVLPDEGSLLSKVTVQKPDALIPGNIAEGVKIAGIIGAMAAGGGGSVKIATGTFNMNTSGPFLVESNHGFKPDLILAWPNSSANIYSVYSLLFGVSKELSATTGKAARGFKVKGNTNYHYVLSDGYNTIESQSTSLAINNATENKFQTISGGLFVGEWRYLILGGLT